MCSNLKRWVIFIAAWLGWHDFWKTSSHWLGTYHCSQLAGLLNWIDAFEFLSATKGRPIPPLRSLIFVHMVFWVSPKPQTHGRFQEVVGKNNVWSQSCMGFFYTSMAENWRLVTSTSEGPKERVCSQNARHEFVLLQPELAASHLVCQPGGSATRPYCNSSVQWGARCTNLRHLTQASVVCMSGKTAQNNGGLTSSLT